MQGCQHGHNLTNTCSAPICLRHEHSLAWYLVVSQSESYLFLAVPCCWYHCHTALKTNKMRQLHDVDVVTLIA